MTTATKILTSIKNDFAGLKNERFTPADVEAQVQEYINEHNSFRVAHLEEKKMKVNGKFAKSEWLIVYDWNNTISKDSFKSKGDAQEALEYYLDHMETSPAIKCWKTLLLDRIRAEVTHRLLNGYHGKVAEVQAKQGEFLAKQARNSVKSLLKGFRR